MRSLVIAAVIISCICAFPSSGSAQGEDICREAGEAPTREVARPGRRIAYVYGRVVFKSHGPGAPTVTVIYSDSLQPVLRQTVGRSGSYCFRIQGVGAKLRVEVDGVEAAQKTLSDLGIGGQREDFEISPPNREQNAPPGVISARFTRPQNPNTLELYKKTAQAESSKQSDKAIGFVKEIVAIDPDDFVAWAKLGSLYLAGNSLADAESAFKKSLDLKPDYVPALINVGMINAVQDRYPAAIEMFKLSVASDPTYAQAHRLLGEAYLHNRQGTLGLQSLDQAIALDPLGMAECHLLKARLYDLAGAKNLASHEYKIFLTKVKDHPDRKKFEKYVKDNPE